MAHWYLYRSTVSRRILAFRLLISKKGTRCPGFVAAQCLGAFTATILFRWLIPSLPSEAKDVAFPHIGGRD